MIQRVINVVTRIIIFDCDMHIFFQVLSLHYIHTSYTFFPPKRQVFRAKRTDKLLFTSLLILEMVSLKFSSKYSSKSRN